MVHTHVCVIGGVKMVVEFDHKATLNSFTKNLEKIKSITFEDVNVDNNKKDEDMELLDNMVIDLENNLNAVHDESEKYMREIQELKAKLIEAKSVYEELMETRKDLEAKKKDIDRLTKLNEYEVNDFNKMYNEYNKMMKELKFVKKELEAANLHNAVNEIQNTQLVDERDEIGKMVKDLEIKNKEMEHKIKDLEDGDDYRSVASI